jgi:hypothetical protein
MALTTRSNYPFKANYIEIDQRKTCNTEMDITFYTFSTQVYVIN